MNSAASAHQLSKQELWYGRTQEPLERREVLAGELTVELEATQIRAVRAADIEILRGVYMAVRDEQWGTVAGQITDLETSCGEGEFSTTFSMSHQQSPLSFDWKGRIAGDRSGTITFGLEGVARSAFRYSRIGFCLLHPPSECAGQRYRGRSSNGTVEGTLPLSVGPQVFEREVYWPLFASVSELELELRSGLTVHMRFEGDLFEMEDQRNWTDASFKTYCTPQELGYPFDASSGQRFSQKVTIHVSGRPRKRRTASRPTQVTFDPDESRPLPPIGFCLPRTLERHTAAETTLLSRAHPRHLRVDLDLAADRWSARLAGAVAVGNSLGCQLEVAAFAENENQIDQLVADLTAAPLARLLMFTRGEEMSDPAWTARARRLCKDHGLAIPVIGGTDLWFAELNRDRPDTDAMDGLVYSITPQVHTFDEESIAQSLEAQPDSVKTTIGFAGGLPVTVGPVTLRPRDPIEFEPATPEAGSLPFSVDPRQSSLFAAAWTVGSISALAQAGAASLTYYETSGCRGIIPGDGPVPARGLFAGAPPGGAYAIFHVFADVLELGSTTRLVRCESSRPSQVAALALRASDRLRLLIANLTPAPVNFVVDPALVEPVATRLLDETTALEALVDPLAYRERSDGFGDPLGEPVTLAPFGLARLDGHLPGH